MNISTASAMHPDISKFKCYRFTADGSIYYGEIMYQNLKTGALVNILTLFIIHFQVPNIDGMDEDTKKQHKMIRHGYGLQIFNGQRNSDGVLTKYEGSWDRDRKHGDNSIAVFKDGSIYTGSYKKDHFEGYGKFEWAVGHIYEGQWKESQMEGSGDFKHANGRSHQGTFRRNYYLQDKCFINPLDDEKKQKKNIKEFEEQVLAQKEKIVYDKRMRLYHVQSFQQLDDAVRETRNMNRIPLFVRTPSNQLNVRQLIAQILTQKNELIEKIQSVLSLQQGPEGLSEVNLRKIFSETMSNPIKKTEMREKLNHQIKKAIQNSQLILLNFDDFEYPENVLDQQNQLSSNKDQDQQTQSQTFAIGYDPNLKEYSGTKAGIPTQLWTPNEISKRRELMEQIGMISAEDEIVPNFSDNIHFVVWSNLELKSKQAQKQILERVVAQHQDDMSLEVNAQTIKENYQYDESQFNDTEILEKIEKRFGKALPLDCINLVLLQEMN
eukprot:403346805